MDVPEIWPDLKRFAEIRSEAQSDVLCDLKGLKWVYPSTLLPLGCYLKTSGQRWIAPTDEGVASYISLMIEPRVIDLVHERTYMPILSLPGRQSSANDMVDYIARFHRRGKGFGGENAFKYLVGELTTNIYEHSGFANAFVMAQKYEKKKFLEMAFFDDGVTIPGSLKRAGLVFDDDREAILKAVDGLSSKADVARGYGLRSNMRMCTQGLRGRIFVSSGFGAMEYGTVGQNKYIPTGYRFRDEKYRLHGTLVSVRIPYDSQDVNLYDFAGK